MIERETLARMTPELLNQWNGPAMIDHARAVGGEAFAWGVAFALVMERKRITDLVLHFRKAIPTATPGELLARRLVYTAKEARAVVRKAWRESRGIRWQ